jgi:threonine 3-dehydrogenase
VNLRVINWQGVYGRRIWTSWERLQELCLTGQLDLEKFIEGELSIRELPDKLDDIKALPGKVMVRP